MRQLLVREQCLQREQKLAHSNKQQLPLTAAKSSHNSKHEMATATIAITRGATAAATTSGGNSTRLWPNSRHPKSSLLSANSASASASTGAQNKLNTLANCNHDEDDRIWNWIYKDYKFEEKLNFHLVLSKVLVKRHCQNSLLWQDWLALFHW